MSYCHFYLQVCSLERFRSLQDKLVLLDEAVAGHDGNVITAVSPAGAETSWVTPQRVVV